MPVKTQILKADELPSEIYHSLPYLSFSQLKVLLGDHTPLDFWYKSWLNPHRPGDDEKTPAVLQFGRAMHCFMLEPEEFRLRWRLEPKYMSSTMPYTVGSQAGGDYEVMCRLRDSIMDNPLAVTILKDCRPEVSMITELEVPDMQAPPEKWPRFGVRCRHDIFKTAYSCDFKFVQSVTDSAISDYFRKYRSHNQADWYLRIMKKAMGTDHQNFAFIFCEKSPPYKVRVVQVMDGPMADARAQNDNAFAKFAEYMAKFGKTTKAWPSYAPVIYQLVNEGEGGPNSIELRDWFK